MRGSRFPGMPRQRRLLLPGIAVHVIQRGNNRQQCFHRDSDYILYLLHLRELAPRHGCQVHAYCLMTNHVHLLMTPSDADELSALIRDLGQRYVQYFNRKYGRSGTLWEGRFRSCITESARYVLACYRYIELNPVRARLVEQPEKYVWSSHQSNVQGVDDRLTVAHPEYLALGQDDTRRRQAYLGLFEAELEQPLLRSIRDATNGGYPLGSEAFLSGGSLPAGQKAVRGKPGRPARKAEIRDVDTLKIGL